MTPQTTFCLKDQIAYLEGLPTEQQAPALIRAIRDSFGDYMEPGKATHLFEATLMGIHVRADNQRELVVNWLRAAKNVAKGIDPDQNAQIEALHLDQLVARARALAIIASPDAAPAAILEACQLILRTSADPLERLCASQVSAQIARAA